MHRHVSHVCRRISRLASRRRLLPGSRSRRALGIAVVRGRSMQPTLYDGDRLLVLHAGRPRAGRLVVVRLAGVVAVKRAVRREPGGWWVERDNPHEGVDSWSHGAVPDAEVVAVALIRFWPPRRKRSA